MRLIRGRWRKSPSGKISCQSALTRPTLVKNRWPPMSNRQPSRTTVPLMPPTASAASSTVGAPPPCLVAAVLLGAGGIAQAGVPRSAIDGSISGEASTATGAVGMLSKRAVSETKGSDGNTWVLESTGIIAKVTADRTVTEYDDLIV